MSLPIEDWDSIVERVNIEEIEEEKATAGKESLLYQCRSTSGSREDVILGEWSVFSYQEPMERVFDYISHWLRDYDRVLVQLEEKVDSRDIVGVRPTLNRSYSYGLVSERCEDEFIQAVEDLGYRVEVPVEL